MNNKKNTDILSIVQNHYQRESTISIFAPIEDVRKTFEALSKTGMYIQFWKFDVRCYGKTVEIDGPPSTNRSLRLVTKATLEQRLDGDGTILNLSTQISKKEVIISMIRAFIFFMGLLSFLIYFELEPWVMSISYLVFCLAVHQGIWASFDGSTNLLVRHLQRGQVWNGLGYEKPTINDLWSWFKKK